MPMDLNYVIVDLFILSTAHMVIILLLLVWIEQQGCGVQSIINLLGYSLVIIQM